MKTFKTVSTIVFHRNEVSNLARRCGFNLIRYYDRSFGARFYQLKARHRGRSFPYPGTTRGYYLDFCPTQQHTALERVFLYLSGKAKRLAN